MSLRRDPLDAEQGLAVRAAVAFLQPPLERKEGRALHEKHRERRQTEIGHGDVPAPTLARVRKRGANGLQARQKRRQNLHPQGESFLPLIWESPYEKILSALF